MKRKKVANYYAIDLFSGCGGLTEGMKKAGFRVTTAVELDKLACDTYHKNHPEVTLVQKDIKKLNYEDLNKKKYNKVHLVSGCPPCQGFSSIRRKNKRRPSYDNRNWLISDFEKIIKHVKPYSIFLENVPGIENYHRFKIFLKNLEKIGYHVNYEILDLYEYGVPQRRKRVVVLAGLGFEIDFPKKSRIRRTVKSTIGDLKKPSAHHNKLHKDNSIRSDIMIERIKATPKNGGSRKDWPVELKLTCHKKSRGFNDVYGRMKWSEPSPTITGGCINPSKGRFLHPSQNRVITLFEAALLQTFRKNYYFSLERGKYPTAEMIGNALPPEFAKRIGNQIIRTLREKGID